MPKMTVYCFRKFSINEGEYITDKRMATLEAIKRFQAEPLMDTGKEVDTSELDQEGRYPKTYTVSYSTKSFPIFNSPGAKQQLKDFSSFEAAKSAPFPTDDKYVFASILVVGGFYTRKVNSNEWEFISFHNNSYSI